MKILFTSDLHADLDGFRRFADCLREGDYDVGVVAGDLGDYNLTLKEIGATPGVEEDDLLEELYDPEDTVEDLEGRVNEYRQNPNTPLAKAVRHQEKTIRHILGQARRPIIIVPGNHDLSEWRSGRRIRNVHNRRYRYKGFNFVGYRSTRLEVTEKEEENQLLLVGSLLEANTILVTHAPPFGVLDNTHNGRHIGSRPLSRLSTRPEVALHLFGHVHASFGHTGRAANGSYAHERRFLAIEVGAANPQGSNQVGYTVVDLPIASPG
jgi:Icc-related predicted phosphoesterase